MIQTLSLAPGFTLRCCEDTRFKQGGLSLQLVRPMCREEAAMNALLPAVLLHTDLYRSCPCGSMLHHGSPAEHADRKNTPEKQQGLACYGAKPTVHCIFPFSIL